MPKIAYNDCFGGFSLSDEAVKLGRRLSNNPMWNGACFPGEVYSDGSVKGDEYASLLSDSHHLDDSIKRTDPILIAVIEQLGSKANGRCADLKIIEVAYGAKYRIDEYDGNENVMFPNDYNWETAE